MAEQCVSDDGTELALAHRRVLYRPPRGWQFARSADSVVVVAQEGQAAVAFRFATGERANQLIPELERLVKDLGIEGVNFATLRGRLRMPQHESKDGLLPLRLWEVSSNHQGGVAPRLDTAGDGTLLVVEAKLEDGRAVVGAAFVADTAANLATLIMNSLRSLQLEPSGAKPGLSPDASDR
ncbi:MAG TPA: hypothetical protein VF989_09020 [Polyangiaceae bacterium]